MKRILITGKNSYLGISLENWLLKEPDKFKINTICLKDGSWKNADFSSYDVLYHVAGIAHVSSDPKYESLYYKVNRDLAIEIAKKAKEDGVAQFIFLSSIVVYGDSKNSKEKRVIDEKTIPAPTNPYGESKLQAEEGIKKLESDKFKVVILRLPMVYGKASKGNYSRLAKLAIKMPVFPDIENERSMLYIDNLCEFTKIIIKREENGLFFPQNKEYVKTSDMVKKISNAHGKKIWMTTLFNPILKRLYRIGIITRVFGNLMYDKSMSEYDQIYYQIIDFKESIELTEK